MSLKKLQYAFATIFAGGVMAIAACGTNGELDADDGAENVATASEALSLGSSLGTPLALPPGSPLSTCGLYNGVSPTCTTSNASDISFVWTAPCSGYYFFSTSGSNFDTVLVLSSYLNPGSIITCADNVRSSQGGDNAYVYLSAGAQIIVTVDGYQGLCGNYKLNISTHTSTSCNGQCTDLKSDSCNCGACGAACAANAWCANGTCKTCFASGTPIAMADGTEKPIESVAVGDQVLGYDTVNNIIVPARVSRTFVHPDVENSLLINGKVRVTAEHPFYVNGTWVEAGNLRTGDELHQLLSSDAEPRPVIMPINKIEKLVGSITTYNFEVEDVHDYFADGYLVHNKPEGCSLLDPDR